MHKQFLSIHHVPLRNFNSLVSVVQRLKLGQRNSSNAFVSASVHGPDSGAEMPLASVGTGEKPSRFREVN